MKYFSKNIQEPIPPGFVIFINSNPIAGIQFRREDAINFIHSTEVQSLELEHEPTNPKDPNALKIIGVTPSKRVVLGYLYKEYAKQIADSGMLQKIKPRLMRVYEGKNFIDITFQILGPKEEKSHFESFKPIAPASEIQLEFLRFHGIKEAHSDLTHPEAAELILSLPQESQTLFMQYGVLVDELTDPEFSETYNIEPPDRSEIIAAIEELIRDGENFENIVKDSDKLIDKLTGYDET